MNFAVTVSDSIFRATVCKTVRPTLSDRCLSVCLCLVTLVYCGQTVGWIKVPLGTEVGLGPGHIVLDGDSAPPTERGTAAPTFRPMLYCGQTVAHLSSCSALVLTANCPDYMLHETSVQATHYGSCAGLTDVGHVRYKCGSRAPVFTSFLVDFRCPAMPSYGCLAQYCGNVGPQIRGALFSLTV